MPDHLVAAASEQVQGSPVCLQEDSVIVARDRRSRGSRLDHLGEAFLLAARLAHAPDQVVHEEADPGGEQNESDGYRGEVPPVRERAEAVAEASVHFPVADQVEQRHRRKGERSQQAPSHQRPGQREHADEADHRGIVDAVAGEELAEAEREEDHREQDTRQAQGAPARREQQANDRQRRCEDLDREAAASGEDVVDQRHAQAHENHQRRKRKQPGLDAELGVLRIFRRKLEQPGKHSLSYREAAECPRTLVFPRESSTGESR